MTDPSKRRTGKKSPAVIYPNIPSSIAPVPHGSELSVSNPPQGDKTGDDSNCSEGAENFKDPIYSAEDGTYEKKPYYPS